MRFAAAVLLLGLAHAASAAPCVVLLHGLVRSASAMEPMADALGKLGYVVANIDYPSREGTIEELAPRPLRRVFEAAPSRARRR